MLIHSASQLLTLSGGPQPGSQLGRLGIISNGFVLIRDEKIVAVGETEKMADKFIPVNFIHEIIPWNRYDKEYNQRPEYR